MAMQWSGGLVRIHARLRRRLSRRIILVAGLSFAAVALMLAAFGPAAAEAITLATSRQPSPYAELYFLAPDRLPQQLLTGTSGRFGFAVVSHGQPQATYHYVVTQHTGAAQSQLSQGELSLVDGESAYRYGLMIGNGAETVVSVELTNSALAPETIRFRSRP